MLQLTLEALQSGFEAMEQSPQDQGVIEMIVCRPQIGERIVLQQAELDLVVGLVGDNWLARGSRHTEDGSAQAEAQITLMNSRIIQLITQDQSRWPLAGDQLFVDLDLSAENMPPGQQIAIGTAILEVSALPHNGCGKFTERFGSDATRFINSPEGRAARRRGINARVIQPGIIQVGDTIAKITIAAPVTASAE